MDVLARIKRLVSRGDVVFTEKAEDEMEVDGLFREDVIIGRDSQGTQIYTKGAIRGPQGQKAFYILVSAKLASRSD